MDAHVRLNPLLHSLTISCPPPAHVRSYPLSEQSKDRTTRLRLLRQLDRVKDGGSADCATDTFVSGHGLAWVDLSAGPFTWGPVVGGSGPVSGLRGPRSLPSVAAAFSAMPAAAAPQSTRAELEAALEELADQRFAEARPDGSSRALVVLSLPSFLSYCAALCPVSHLSYHSALFPDSTHPLSMAVNPLISSCPFFTSCPPAIASTDGRRRRG